MTTASRRAYAKINLSLDVTGRREDGYHLVDMVMQDIGLFDDVTVSLTGDGGISVRTNLSYLPENELNTAYKAARLFFEHTRIVNPGVEIRVEKRIPVAAGLAGGSSDGAAALRLLNDLLSAGLDDAELSAIGAKLGADVPYCLCGGTQRARGAGENLTPLPHLPPVDIVLCKPPGGISTAKAYSLLDRTKISQRPDTDGLIKALERADIGGVARRMYNVLEPVGRSLMSDIALIGKALLDSGASGAVMSGSGSSVFGLFEDHAAAAAAYGQLKGSYKETFLTKTL